MSHSHETTIPWHDSELMLVNGHPLLYTITKADGMLCRLPGGKSETVEGLRAKGFNVVMPKRVRIFD